MVELTDSEIQHVSGGATWLGLSNALAQGGVAGLLGGLIAAGVGAGPGFVGGALIGGMVYLVGDMMSGFSGDGGC